jgi:hypothetical protein
MGWSKFDEDATKLLRRLGFTIRALPMGDDGGALERAQLTGANIEIWPRDKPPEFEVIIYLPNGRLMQCSANRGELAEACDEDD